MAHRAHHDSEMIPNISAQKKNGGFTRTEVVVTIGCVVILAGVALLWRARNLDLPKRTVCQNNLKVLLAGFNAHVESTGYLPWGARSRTTNDSDWIYWQSDRILEQSPIARHATNFTSALRCPGDDSYHRREYPYSYSMNAHLEKLKRASIVNASSLILLYEENFPNDGACAPNDMSDALSKRHMERSNAGFWDGHVETVSRASGGAKERMAPVIKPATRQN